MKRAEPRTIRVIEWEPNTLQSEMDFTEPSTHPDAYQVLIWISRQVMLKNGYRIGFEKPSAEIRIQNYRTIQSYVAAILGEIEQQEKDRKKRFDAAKEFYDYSNSEEPDSSIIAQFYEEIGVDGQNAATSAALLATEQPKTLLRYGFERLF